MWWREVEFRQAMTEREWQYKRLERVLELVSYLLQCYLVLTKSVLSHVLNHIICDRLESELELVCYCNAIFFKLSQS